MRYNKCIKGNMLGFYLFFLTGCLSLLVACDSRKEWVTQDNSAPVLLFLKNSRTTLTDSVKYSLKVREKKEISVSFSVHDDNHNLNSVTIIHSEGEAVRALRESLPLSNDGKYTTTFDVIKPGTSIFNFTAEDNLGATSSIIYQVKVFDNLPPIARLVLTRDEKSSNNGKYSLNASHSTDKDSGYGGEISYYKFTIISLADKKSKTWQSANPIQPHSFNSAGEFLIKLVVTDNDGATAAEEKNVIIQF